jgi:tetratricopeptide (TPR) repeat protein
MYRLFFLFFVAALFVGMTGSGALAQQGRAAASGDVLHALVDVRASDLSEEPFTQWTNAGTLPGAFTSRASQVRIEMVAGRRAVVFDGGGELVSSFSAGPEFTGGNPYTVAVWAWNPTIEPEECMVTWSRRRGEMGTGAQLNYGANPLYGAVGHYSWTMDLGFRGGPPVAGRWHHIAVTYDQKMERVFVDGALDAEAERTLNICTGEPVRIGSAGGEIYFSGAVAQVQVFDRALTGRQIALLHLQGLGSDQFRAWHSQSMREQAVLPANERVTFLRRMIQEFPVHGIASSRGACSLDSACGDLHFGLALTMPQSDTASDEAITAYQRSVVSSHAGTALLWLHAHGTADQYGTAVQLLCRHPDLLYLLPIVVDEIASAGDSAVLERLIEVLFRTVPESTEMADALYNATAWNAKAREGYLACCRSRPDLSRHAFARDLQRGQRLFEKSDFSNAAAFFQQVGSLYPPGEVRMLLQYRMSESLSKAGRHAEAIASLEQLLQPAQPIGRTLAARALQLKGQCHIAVGESDKAVGAFVTVVAEYSDAPNAPEVAFLIGYCYALQGDFARAKDAFHCVVRQYPGSEYAQKATTYIRRIEAMT